MTLLNPFCCLMLHFVLHRGTLLQDIGPVIPRNMPEKSQESQQSRACVIIVCVLHFILIEGETQADFYRMEWADQDVYLKHYTCLYCLESCLIMGPFDLQHFRLINTFSKPLLKLELDFSMTLGCCSNTSKAWQSYEQFHLWTYLSVAL